MQRGERRIVENLDLPIRGAENEFLAAPGEDDFEDLLGWLLGRADLGECGSRKRYEMVILRPISLSLT